MSALVLVMPLFGCAGRGSDPANADVPGATTSGTMPLDSVYQLETTGAPPGDTSVTVTAGRPHVVVMRHGPPDNAVFAEVRFDTAAFQAPPGAAVQVAIHPRPGVYGVGIETSAPLREAALTFKYAVHFLESAGARARYGSDIGFERVLGVARLDGGTVTFMPSTRPAIDNLRALVSSPGTYLVGAPR